MSDQLGWGPILEGLRDVEPGSPRAELHRAGAALRAAVHRLVRLTGEAADIARVADAIEAVTAQLEALPLQVEYEGFAESSISGGVFGFFDRGPMLGHINPLAPPLEMWQEGERMLGKAYFGPAYEGPPGCVHGGFIAAAFDELLGCTQTMSGAPGMTGRLTVSYRSPTPLESELRFEGRIVEVSGRKILTAGTLSFGDRLCAEAEGLFITVDPVKFAALRDERAERAGRGD